MSPDGTGLIPWSKVIELEATQKRKLAFSDLRCSISEIIFIDCQPILFGNRSHWLKNARVLIDEKLSTVSDLNMRRSMRAKFFKHGKLTPQAIQLLAQQQAAAIKSVSEKLPEMLPLVEKGGMYDLLAGKVSSEKFAVNFMKAVGNPVVLANLATYPEFNSIMEISKFLWNETDRLVSNISKLVEGLVQIQLISGPLPFDRLRAEIGKVIRPKNSRAKLASAIVGKSVDADSLPNMPGLRCL